MAETTLKDVLNAIETTNSRLDATNSRLDQLAKDVAAHRAETAVRFESVERNIAAIDRSVAEHRRETREGFAALDRELEDHADPLHRELGAKVDKLAKDVAALKAARPRTPRPARRG